MPSIAKRLLRRKYTKHLLSSFQSTESSHTSGSILAEKIEQIKKTKHELEIKKNVDCPLEGDGNYSSNVVIFEVKCS